MEDLLNLAIRISGSGRSPIAWFARLAKRRQKMSGEEFDRLKGLIEKAERGEDLKG